MTSVSYNAAGWVDTTTNPRGLVTKHYYDPVGRTTKTIEAYTDGVVTDSTNKTTEFTYNGDNNRLTSKASLTGGSYQTTAWAYGVSTTTGSDISSNEISSQRPQRSQRKSSECW